MADLRGRLAAVEGSAAWAMVCKAESRLQGPFGRTSLAGRAIRSIGRRALARAATDGDASASEVGSPIVFPHFEHPAVSLIIPVHAQAPLTAACLRSIVRNTEAPRYELVIVDDTADPPTKALLENVENARVLVNPENLGFSGA